MTVFVRDDLEGLAHLDSGAIDLLRQPRARAIRQRIDTPTARATEHAAEHAAQHAQLALRGGAEELLIRCHPAALATVLGPVDLTKTRVALDMGAASRTALEELRQIARQRRIPAVDLRIELGLDPLHQLICASPSGTSRDDHVAQIVDAVLASADLPGCVPIAVHGTSISRAGASSATELACAIATGIEYLRRLLGAATLDIDADSAVRKICFRLPVNTELYQEVAKLRAVRLLWAKVAQSFGARELQTTIHAESSHRSHATDDVHTNLIRTGIQAFAATLANCDSITIGPFEATTDPRNRNFVDALARNQQLLLREESMLHRVDDPCGGSYAVEVLTDRIARDAWEFVREIEGQGGMLRALENGTVQRRVQAAADARRHQFQTRQRSLVGTNRYVDPLLSRAEEDPTADAAATWADLDAQSSNQPAGGDLSLSIPCQELAADGAAFEQLRSLVRRGAHRVLPVLAGPSRASRARLEFARDYFTAGGFEVLPPTGLAAVTDSVQSAADYFVLCSDDASQDEAVEALSALDTKAASTARQRVRTVVVGTPREALANRTAACIHDGDDTYLTLRELYLRLHEDEDEDGGEGGGEGEDRGAGANQ